MATPVQVLEINVAGKPCDGMGWATGVTQSGYPHHRAWIPLSELGVGYRVVPAPCLAANEAGGPHCTQETQNQAQAQFTAWDAGRRERPTWRE